MKIILYLFLFSIATSAQAQKIVCIEKPTQALYQGQFDKWLTSTAFVLDLDDIESGVDWFVNQRHGRIRVKGSFMNGKAIFTFVGGPNPPLSEEIVKIENSNETRSGELYKLKLIEDIGGHAFIDIYIDPNRENDYAVWMDDMEAEKTYTLCGTLQN